MDTAGCFVDKYFHSAEMETSLVANSLVHKFLFNSMF